ncbi:MAG: carbohydrate kinase family protein [Lachnospiraceae bacterium]|nr:carbohydrate kinase family protein [Lachnospiraceae bacterium]
MNKKAIVAGHICIDITPVFPEGKVRKLSEVMIPGKTINMEQAVVNTGGAVANTGLAMKIFGAEVKLIGKIGPDEIGGMIRNVMKKYEADQDIVVSDEAGSSYTIVLAPPGIDRMFLHSPGLNDTFGSADVSDEALDGVSLMHFGYPSLMRKMYLNGGEELVSLYRRAKERGVVTSLDFSAIDAGSEAGSIDWKHILQEVIPYVDFFVPSLEELGYMMDPELYYEWQRKADGGSIESVITVEHDVRPLADTLLSWGARGILIKCGAPGMYYRTADQEKMQPVCDALGLSAGEWSDMEGFEQSFVPEQVKSGTGAGDTSIAAFLTSILRGYSLEKSVRMATAAGAACVEAYDALSGLTSFEALEERIARGWKKQK